MKLAKLWPLALVPLALAACGMNDTDAEEDDPTDGAADTVAAAAPAPPPVAPAPAAMAPMMVPMAAVGGSGVSGQATLTEAGTQTQVAVQLTGFAPSSSHSGHVHQGTCDAPGAPVAPLQDIAADASGAGSATSTVAIPAATVMNGQHIIAYHQGAGDAMGPPVVCGSIPGHAM